MKRFVYFSFFVFKDEQTVKKTDFPVCHQLFTLGRHAIRLVIGRESANEFVDVARLEMEHDAQNSISWLNAAAVSRAVKDQSGTSV